MSATPGKVEIVGVIPRGSKDLLMLQYLQARMADQVRRPLLAEADPSASWYDELRLVESDALHCEDTSRRSRSRIVGSG